MKLAEELAITKVFLSTDAKPEEIMQLESSLKQSGQTLYRFEDKEHVLSDGAVAIVDQVQGFA